MKYLLLLISLSCGAAEIYPQFTDRVNPNGWLTRSSNEVEYTSHRQGFAYGQSCEAHYCRKTDSLYDKDSWVANKETKYDFYLRINKYNHFAAPDWIIIFQDWALIDANDTNGNHPITTLKLKPLSNGRIKLALFENSWQFDYSTTNPIDPSDPYDYDHNHADNLERGSVIYDSMIILEWIHIELTIRDGATIEDGSVNLVIDNQEIVDAQYRTKNTQNRHFAAFGMYWSKWYNTDYNYCANWYADEMLCKSTSITIKDLHIYQ